MQAQLSESLSTWFSFLSLSLLMGLISQGSKPPPINHMGSLSGITNPILSHLIGKVECVLGEPITDNRDAPVTREIPRV